MRVILHNCCGLDVHKDNIVACILKTVNISDNERKDEIDKDIRVFNTFPSGLNELKSWLESQDCQHVVMESTGVYWHPVYDTLEDAFDENIEILVVNARHLKNVRGKKTDIKDAEWLADMLRHGLVRGSFIPPQDVRKLRQQTRYRKTIVNDISTQKNRIEKTLQTAGFKLSTFLSDVFGVSGRNLINVLIKKGHLTAHDVETEAKRIAADKRANIAKAINGKLDAVQRNFLGMQIDHLNSLQSHLYSIEMSINELSAPYDEAIKRVDTIPGIGLTAATAIIAEVSTDMSKFPSAEHFCSWAGVTPGANISAGKKKTQESCTEIPTLKD